MALTIRTKKDYNKAQRKLIKLAMEDIASTIFRGAITVFQQLQARTPRDTGRAINGWIPVVDKPPSNQVPPKGLSFYPPRPFINPRSVKANSIIWITNNVEYIEYLEEGHSSQAENGFIDQSFRMGVFYFERRIRKLTRKRYNV